MPPQIRQYSRRVGVSGSLGPAPNARVVQSPDYMGAAIGDVQQALGRVAQAAGNFQEVEQQQALKSSAAWAGKATAESRLYWMQELEASKKDAAPDAKGFTPAVLQKFDKWKEAQLASAPDDAARQMFSEKLPYIQADVADDAMRYEAVTGSTFRKGQVVDAIEASTTLAYLQPHRRGQILDEQLSLIDAAGLPAAEANAIKGKTRQALADAAWRARANSSPAATIKALNDPNMTADGAADLDLQSRLQITGQAEAEMRRQEAEQKRVAAERRSTAAADLRGSLEDELARRAEGMPIEKPVTRASVNAAYGDDPRKAEQVWSQVSTAQKYADATGLVKGISVQQQDELLASIKPDPSKPGFADALKAYRGVEQDVNANRSEGAQQLAARADQELTALRSGQTVAQPLTEDDVHGVVGDKVGASLWQTLQDERASAKAVASVPGSTLAAQSALLDYTKPDPNSPRLVEQTKAHDVLQQVIAEDRRARAVDPAGYAVTNVPSVRKAFEAGDIQGGIRSSLSWQEQAGVAAADQRPLPKAMAQQLVTQIAGASDPVDMVDTLAANTITIRDPVVRGQVVDQLVEAGLPQGSAYAVDAVAQGRKESAIRIMTALSAPKPELDKDTKKLVDTAITNTLATRNDALASVSLITGDMGPVSRASTDHDLLTRLSGNQSLASGAPDKAVERSAADAFGGEQVVNLKGGLFGGGESWAAGIVPAGVDLAKLETGLDALRTDPKLWLDRAEIEQTMATANMSPDLRTHYAATVDSVIEHAADQGRFVLDDEGVSYYVPIPRNDGTADFVRLKSFQYGQVAR